MPSRASCSASPTPCSAWPPAPRRWPSTTSWPPRRRPEPSPSARASPWTSTSACRSTTRDLPERHPQGLRRPGSTSHQARCRGHDIPATSAFCASYEGHRRGRQGSTCRSWASRHGRAHRLRRTGSSLASRTRIKTLTRQTRIDQVLRRRRRRRATHCLTQGLGTIMSARHRAGRHRHAEGRGGAPDGRRPGGARLWPKAILQHHPHVTVLLDGASASRLQLADYYQEALPFGQPAWRSILTSLLGRRPDAPPAVSASSTSPSTVTAPVLSSG